MSNNTYTDPVTGKRYEKVKEIKLWSCWGCDMLGDFLILTPECKRIQSCIGHIFKLIPTEGEKK